MKNKNGLITGLVVGFGVLLFLGLSFVLNSEADKKEEQQSVANWKIAVESGKPVVTVLGSSSCPHCQSYKPIINALAKEKGFELFFYEVDKLSEEDYDTVNNTFELIDHEGYVPYTYVVIDNKFVDGETGLMEKETLTQYLINTGVLEN